MLQGRFKLRTIQTTMGVKANECNYSSSPETHHPRFWRAGLRQFLSIGILHRNRFNKAQSLVDQAKVAMVYGFSKNRKLQQTYEIVEQFPECLHATNCFGQTPLHLAAERCASIEVVAYIALKYPKACTIEDYYGKLPLHYLVANSKVFLEEVIMKHLCTPPAIEGLPSVRSYEDDFLDVVEFVIEIFPDALTHEDQRDRNPIETAILHDAPLNVVGLLQRKSRNLWKSREYQKNEIIGRCA